MLIAVINNLPELILGAVFAAAAFSGGMKFERWRNARRG